MYVISNKFHPLFVNHFFLLNSYLRALLLSMSIKKIVFIYIYICTLLCKAKLSDFQVGSKDEK